MKSEELPCGVRDEGGRVRDEGVREECERRTMYSRPFQANKAFLYPSLTSFSTAEMA